MCVASDILCIHGLFVMYRVIVYRVCVFDFVCVNVSVCVCLCYVRACSL